MAGVSSGPSISSVTFDPLPAASIMTPMMLLAFTLRPLRPMLMSLWKRAASWVSLAAARAWRPSLLMISTSRCCIDGVHVDVQHAFATARDRLLDERVHPLRPICERAHQHRQIDAGNHLDAAGLRELHRKIAGSRAEYIRKDHETVAGVELAGECMRPRKELRRVVARRNREDFELRRPRAEDMRDRFDEALAKRVMRDDQDADHGGLLRAGNVST